MATAFQVWVVNGEFPRHLFHRPMGELTRLVYDRMEAGLVAEEWYRDRWISVSNGLELMTRAEFLGLYCTEWENPGTPCQCRSCSAQREAAFIPQIDAPVSGWTVDEILAREG